MALLSDIFSGAKKAATKATDWLKGTTTQIGQVISDVADKFKPIEMIPKVQDTLKTTVSNIGQWFEEKTKPSAQLKDIFKPLGKYEKIPEEKPKETKIFSEKIISKEIKETPEESKWKDVGDALKLSVAHLFNLGKNYFTTTLPQQTIDFITENTKSLRKVAGYTEKDEKAIEALKTRAKEEFQIKYQKNKENFNNWLLKHPELMPRKEWSEGAIATIKKNPASLKDPAFWAYQIASTAPYMVAAMGAGAATFAATKNPYASIAAGMAVTTPITTQNLYDDLIENGATNDEALKISGTVGPIIASVEVISDIPILKSLGIGKMLTKEASKEAAKLSLKKLAAKGIGKFSLIESTETLEEIAQEAIQNAAVKVVNKNRSIFENIPETAVTTAMATLPLAILGGAKEVPTMVRQTKQEIIKNLQNQGYSLQEATELASAGGYIGKMPEKGLISKITENIRGYQAYGGFTAGKETPNAYLRDLNKQLNTPEGKKIGKQTLQNAIKKGEIKPNADGTITLYRVGEISDKNPLVSATYDEKFAQQFSDATKQPIKELKVKPEDIKYVIGGAEKEVLLSKKVIKPSYSKSLPKEIKKMPEIVPVEQAEITPAGKKSVEKEITQVIEGGIVRKNIPLKRVIEKTTGIKPEPSPLITKRETTLLKERIKNYARGVREGVINTREQIKEVQRGLVDIIRKTVPLEERGKFLATIKNIQTPEQLAKEMPIIENRINNLIERVEARSVLEKINRELKYTKPLKVGVRRVGKYDYERNKLFEELREYNRLNKLEAILKLDLMPTENLTEIDLIKIRFLELKANGADASLELHKAVLADIQKMKEAGQTAKDEADFNKKLEQAEKIDEVLDGIEKMKGDRKSLLTKMENIYRLGFTNLYSMMSTTIGKNLAEKYDPQTAENNKETAIYQKTKGIVKEGIKIFGVENAGKMLRLLKGISKETYVLTDRDGVKTEIGKIHIMDIYNSIKNNKIRERYYNAFGERQINELINNLSPEEKKYADMLQLIVQEYREVLNKRSIEITGRDLGYVENYWPSTSERTIEILDDIRIQGEIPSAMRERAKSSNIIPKPVNAYLKAMKYIRQAEHIRYLSREYENLKRIFSDRMIRNAMTQKYGENVYNSLMAHIEDLSLNKTNERIDAISSIYDELLNNWVKAKVFSPTVFIRQIVSFINYAENVSVPRYMWHLAEGLAHPKKTFEFMWKNNPELEARFNVGHDEAMAEVLTGVNGIKQGQTAITKITTIPTRAGDIIPIIYGGYASIMAKTEKGMSKEQAIKEFKNQFLKETILAQQSQLVSSRAHFQKVRSPLAKTFFRFKNTTFQYIRKQGDAIINYRNGQISLGKLVKITTIYSIINPILYVLSGIITKDIIKWAISGGENEPTTPEEIAQESMMQIATNPFQAIPILDGVSQYVYRKAAGMKTYNVISTPLLDEIEVGIRKMGKKEPTLLDYIEAISILQEPITGIPTQVGLRYYKYTQPEKEEKIKKEINMLELLEKNRKQRSKNKKVQLKDIFQR